MYKNLLWNDGWQFCLCENDALDINSADNASWTEVEVPHDWLGGRLVHEEISGRLRYAWGQSLHKF